MKWCTIVINYFSSEVYLFIYFSYYFNKRYILYIYNRCWGAGTFFHRLPVLGSSLLAPATYIFLYRLWLPLKKFTGSSSGSGSGSGSLWPGSWLPALATRHCIQQNISSLMLWRKSHWTKDLALKEYLIIILLYFFSLLFFRQLIRWKIK